MKKLAAFALTLSLAAASLTGCASGGAATSAQATAENPMVLTLAHGLSETHTVHIAMVCDCGRVHAKLLDALYIFFYLV